MKKQSRLFCLLTGLVLCTVLSACGSKTASKKVPTKILHPQVISVQKAFSIVKDEGNYYAKNAYVSDEQQLDLAYQTLLSAKLKGTQHTELSNLTQKLPQNFQDLSRTYSIIFDHSTVKADQLTWTQLDGDEYTISIRLQKSAVVKAVDFETWTTLNGKDDLSVHHATYDAKSGTYRATMNLRKCQFDGNMLEINAVVSDGKNQMVLAQTQAAIRFDAIPQLIDHRGNTTQGPENSVVSFALTRHWGTETDTQMTKDGQWVIMHDGTLDRMTDFKGSVGDYTLEELQGAVLKSNQIKDKDLLVIPTLEEYLAVCQQEGSVPVIEIKTEHASDEQFKNFTEAIKHQGLEHRIIVISFYANMLKKVTEELPGTEVMLLSGNANHATLDKVKKLGKTAGLDVDYKKINANLVTKLHEDDISVGVWTVPKQKWAAMRKIGVDDITTDD